MKGGGIQSIQTHCAKEIKSSKGNQTLDSSAPFHGQHTVGRKTQQASNQTKHKQQPDHDRKRNHVLFNAHLQLKTLIFIYKSSLVFKRQFLPQSQCVERKSKPILYCQ